MKIKEVTINSKIYPNMLREIQNPPQKIYVSGNASILNDKSISIVGTRRATKTGIETAKTFAKKLGNKGLNIVSGLALGIDSAAHMGALENKIPTIAVLARGLDKIYPEENAKLAEQIINSGGAIISEYPVGTGAHRHHFLERNRITSGLSISSIVIEAPFKSGSINTAGWAAEQGRLVFVVPGPINHTNYKGSHKLIRDGAILVSSPEDVINDLGMEESYEIYNDANLNENEKNILEIIGSSSPITIDRIIEKSGLEAAIVSITISSLLIKDMLFETARGFEVRINNLT